MKILYSLPHPADRLGTQQAGHMIRASAILNALQKFENEIVRLEAASNPGTQTSVGLYRRVIKRFLPERIAMILRDTARIRHGRHYAQRLVGAIEFHRPDIILETHIAFSLAGKIASEHSGIPLVLDDCAPSWEEEQQYGVGLKETARQIHREVTNHASLLIAVNETLNKHLREDVVSPEKVITIENGIDAEYFNTFVDGSRIRKKYNVPGDKIVIVFVGSFQPYHRVDLLLRAFHSIKSNVNAHLLLVGEGQTSNECMALARELELSTQVSFTGRIPYDEVAAYMAAGDITIMPATNDYGNPMKIYEYMALGLPVLAPNQPTITELVTHNVDAYLFEPENIASMASAIQAVFNNPQLRKRLGEQAIKRASENTWDKRALKLNKAMETILSGK